MKYIKKNEEAVTPVLAVILLVAITVIVAVIIAVFMFGVGAPEDAPQAKLRFVSTGTNLTAYHEGGDPLICNNTKISAFNAIDNTEYDLLGGPYLGGMYINKTFVPGKIANLGWGSTKPVTDDIIMVQALDTITGQMIANVKIVVR